VGPLLSYNAGMTSQELQNEIGRLRLNCDDSLRLFIAEVAYQLAVANERNAGRDAAEQERRASERDEWLRTHGMGDLVDQFAREGWQPVGPEAAVPRSSNPVRLPTATPAPNDSESGEPR
jgi:hypothetical protein